MDISHPFQHYRGFMLSAGTAMAGVLSHLYVAMYKNTTTILLGNIVFIVSIFAGVYSIYTNRKTNRKTELESHKAQLEIKELERRQELEHTTADQYKHRKTNDPK